MSLSSPPEEAEIRDGKIFAILAYLSIFCIIPLAIKKENTFVLKHGKQGLVLFVAEVAVFILSILFGPWLLKLGMFVLLAVSFVGMMAALNGRYVELPIVSHFADKITL